MTEAGLRQAKLVLLGDMGAGKSSLVIRFVKGQYHDHLVSLNGCDGNSSVLFRGGPRSERSGVLRGTGGKRVGRMGVFAVRPLWPRPPPAWRVPHRSAAAPGGIGRGALDAGGFFMANRRTHARPIKRHGGQKAGPHRARSTSSPLFLPLRKQESTIGAAFLTKAMPEHGVKFEIVS